MSLFNWCNHEWEVLVKETQPSVYEEYVRLGGGKVPHNVSAIDLVKKTFVILKCSKCGKLDKNNYDNYQ